MKKDFRDKKVCKQALSGLVIILASPLLYMGGTQGNSSIATFGMTLVIIGIAIAPITIIIHRWNKRHHLDKF